MVPLPNFTYIHTGSHKVTEGLLLKFKFLLKLQKEILFRKLTKPFIIYSSHLQYKDQKHIAPNKNTRFKRRVSNTKNGIKYQCPVLEYKNIRSCKSQTVNVRARPENLLNRFLIKGATRFNRADTWSSVASRNVEDRVIY